jgi:hypothetical protein
MTNIVKKFPNKMDILFPSLHPYSIPLLLVITSRQVEFLISKNTFAFKFDTKKEKGKNKPQNTQLARFNCFEKYELLIVIFLSM